jgi:hypothetical protein
MKIYLRGILLAALALAVPGAARAGDLQLTMQGGRVTIIAHDVPLRQILQEWSRVGNTQIVNAEKLAGPPLTLELVDVPEQQALDTLLRSAAGYMAAPRRAGLTGASVYDRIMILATSHAPAASAAAAPPPAFQPRPQPMPVDDDDEPVNAPVPMPNGNPNGNPNMMSPNVNPNANPNVVGAFPGPQPVGPNGQPVGPNGQPAVGPNGQPMQSPVMTAPRPGAIATPTTPNGAPAPYQPSVVTPVRPGGPGGGPEGTEGTR